MNIFGLDDLVSENDLVLFDTNFFYAPKGGLNDLSLSEKKELYSSITPFFEMFGDYLLSMEDGLKIKVTRNVFFELFRYRRNKCNGSSGFNKNHKSFLGFRREMNRFYKSINRIRDELEFMDQRIVDSNYELNGEQKYFSSLRNGVDNLLAKKGKVNLSETDYDLFLNSLFLAENKQVAMISSDEGIYLLSKFHFKNRPFDNRELSHYNFDFYKGFVRTKGSNLRKVTS